jgi:hypothetical protein
MKTSRSRPPDTTPIPCTVWFGPTVSAKEERDFIDHLASAHGVAVCCWPRDAERIQHLAAAGVPRLLLTRPDAPAPEPSRHQSCVGPSASNEEIHRALVELNAGARSGVACRLQDRSESSTRAKAPVLPRR